MTTMTISLPDPIARQVDGETRTKGFATRSEFFRALLRRYFTNEIAFEPFRPRPLAEIRKDLEKTGKYNKKFISSVMEGLSGSSWYAK